MARISDFAMIHTTDQWNRVAHENTVIEVEKGIVQLAWKEEERNDNGADIPCETGVGMAFDPWCRLYRSRPEAGQVEKLLWGESDATTEMVELFANDGCGSDELGEFIVSDDHAPLEQPQSLAVDDEGRLYIAEAGANRVLVYDLVEHRLLRQVVFSQPPIDLATDGQRLFVLLGAGEDGLAVMEARSDPIFRTLPEQITSPTRIAVAPDGALYLLERPTAEDAAIISLDSPDEPIPVADAGDLIFTRDGILVVARRAGEDFLRFRVEAGQQWQLPHLRALRYDGCGIVLMPDGQIGYWSEYGLRRATLARLRYETSGRVTGFRLDSNEFQTQWGRIFIDACVPKGTSLSVSCLVMDEPPEEATPLPRTPPLNAELLTVHRPDLSPPMPPQEMIENLDGEQQLYRRETGVELPWLCQHDERFETYEAPVIAPPGRYLWLVINLQGSSKFSPKIKSVRVEYPSHDLMRRLPKLYSRDEAAADFLRRYLAMLEGNLRELDLHASYRHLLLDPMAAPAEVLPWLAEFIGLVLDRRWPEHTRRRLIAEGIWLFRYRGTVMGLTRFLEIYLECKVVIIEHFKVRGLGGALVGKSDAKEANSVLGAGFRIGGRIGKEEAVSINGQTIEDAFKTHAHRFSVIIPLSLEPEQRQVVERILEVHRPAHTLYDICTVDAGMRVGIGLYAGLTSIIGRTSGFGRIQIGATLLGQHQLLGQAKPGTHVGSSKLGTDSQVG